MPSNHVLRAMPPEDWKLLEQLAKSLRGGNSDRNRSHQVRRTHTGDRRPRATARITASTGDGAYDAVEVIWDDTAAEWMEIPQGLLWQDATGSTDPRVVGPLREQGGSDGAAVDDVVEARLGPTVNTGDDSTGYGWFFGLGGGASLVEMIVEEDSTNVLVRARPATNAPGDGVVDVIFPFPNWRRFPGEFIQAFQSVNFQSPSLEPVWRGVNSPSQMSDTAVSPGFAQEGMTPVIRQNVIVWDFPRLSF